MVSCTTRIHVDQIDKSRFCDYFDIKTSPQVWDGKTILSASTQIKKRQNDPVSDYIQEHSPRFDYLITKTLYGVMVSEKPRDSSQITSKFCSAITNDSFCQRFTLLTGAARANDEKMPEFSVAEMMKVASRFFFCDGIREQDTIISYHICAAINGISELPASRDYTVLEAFCFEAILKNLRGTPVFVQNFKGCIKRSSERNKPQFTDFKTHLSKVKEDCFADMEKDEELKRVLLKYYRENDRNIGFRIE